MFRLLENLLDPFAPRAAKTPPRTPLRYAVQALWPARRIMALSLALAIVNALIEIGVIAYGTHLIDMLARQTPETFFATHGLELLIVAATLLVIRPITSFFGEAMKDVAFRPNADTMIAWHADAHVRDQSVAWFRDRLSGQIASQVANAAGATVAAAYSLLNTISFVVIYVIGAMAFLASIDVRLTLPLALWAALYLGLMAYMVPRYHKAAETVQSAYAAINGQLVDSYTNIEAIKLFADSDRISADTKAAFETRRQAHFGLSRLEVSTNTGMKLLDSILLVALTGMALWLWQSASAPIGIAAAALALSTRVTGMGEWMLDAVSSLFLSAGALTSALKTVADPIDIADPPNAREMILTEHRISLEQVSHHYGTGAGGLREVSLSVAPGEKIALVGPSGAGKSTLINLILRFYEAEKGKIEIDGQDIISVTQESLRRHISMVAQDATLMHRSVRDNIAYGRAGATDKDIAEAAKKAAADTFIPGLRDREGRTGYDAFVGERGVRLSGGQRQRIALARAILKNAPILILDEATSALDSEIEAAIQDTLDTLIADKTVIAIAHRLSTIARMDRIIVLDKGEIVEQGAHAALLAQNGLYARLWARQSGGFLGTGD